MDAFLCGVQGGLTKTSALRFCPLSVRVGMGRSWEITGGKKRGSSGENHRVLCTEQLSEKREMGPWAKAREDYRVQGAAGEVSVVVMVVPR